MPLHCVSWPRYTTDWSNWLCPLEITSCLLLSVELQSWPESNFLCEDVASCCNCRLMDLQRVYVMLTLCKKTLLDANFAHPIPHGPAKTDRLQRLACVRLCFSGMEACTAILQGFYTTLRDPLAGTGGPSTPTEKRDDASMARPGSRQRYRTWRRCRVPCGYPPATAPRPPFQPRHGWLQAPCAPPSPALQPPG